MKKKLLATSFLLSVFCSETFAKTTLTINEIPATAPNIISATTTDSIIPDFEVGHSYSKGDKVQVDGNIYTCKEPNWCSSDADTFYGPGTGIHWKDAWSLDSEDNDKETIEISQQDLDISEQDAINADKDLLSIRNEVRTLDVDSIEQVTAGSSSNPENVKRVENIIKEKDWDYLFPERDEAYTYNNFLKAVAAFPAFCGDDNGTANADEYCRQSLAMMFAHFAQETGEGQDGLTDEKGEPILRWRQGLYHIRELGYTESSEGAYCDDSKAWPCTGNKSYFGRGAKQLSYNYNYGLFSLAIYGDKQELLDHPEKVADTWLNLASAVFFFVQPQAPKPSMQEIVVGTWTPNDHDKTKNIIPGFGSTILIINGALECGKLTETDAALNRISYYNSFAEYFGVSVDTNSLGCKDMEPFDAEGSAAQRNTFWDQTWMGETSCQLVKYDSGISALYDGTYTSCIKTKFPGVVITE